MKTLTKAWREARAQQIAKDPANPGGGQFIWQDRMYTTRLPHYAFEEELIDPNYVVEPVQSIWLKEEISIAQELFDRISAMTEEFLANTPGFLEGDLDSNSDLAVPIYSAMRTTVPDAQRVDTIKYVHKPQFDVFFENKKYIYPTIVDYVTTLGDNCLSCSYAVLLPSVVNRQISIENVPENKFVRIYVPLIVPDNNFVEVEGLEVNFKDIFAIDTTLHHSEHNLGNTPRLILIMDISREYLGLPSGKMYDWQRQRHIPPFVRGAQAKMYHTVERQA